MKNISIEELEYITGGNDFTRWVWGQVGAAVGHVQNFVDDYIENFDIEGGPSNYMNSNGL